MCTFQTNNGTFLIGIMTADQCSHGCCSGGCISALSNYLSGSGVPELKNRVTDYDVIKLS